MTDNEKARKRPYRVVTDQTAGGVEGKRRASAPFSNGSAAHSFVAIVDDEESVRRAFVRLFDSANFEAEAFASSRDFLRALENRSFDCLVLDLQMPDMTGLDLQRYLRMVCPNLYLPVIIVTAHDEPGMREMCFAAGVRAYLRKPVEASALLAAVADLTAPLN
ncbi:MAG TPA: response regulator [Gammaproteobacteria bacterium]|nr:response regulator [Gammaproteobacteria bacterium]